MSVADVKGVKLAGLLFDAGPKNSHVLLEVGTKHAHKSDANDPTSLHDVFFRIGGAAAGSATTSLVVNSDDVILDDIWAWRADHGNGVGWTVNTADTGVVVNGDDVTAYGLFVEHYQRYDLVWNGESGRTILFQNEMPYDPPNQAAWMNDGVKGFAAYKIADDVKTHEAWGLGSYCFFNVDPSIHATRALRGSRHTRRQAARHPHGLAGRRRHHRPRGQRHGRGRARLGDRPGQHRQLPLTGRRRGAAGQGSPRGFRGLSRPNERRPSGALRRLYPKGWRMTSLSVYGARGDERYAAVWVKRSGADWSAVHGVNAAGYQAAFDNAVAAGFKPVLLAATGRRTTRSSPAPSSSDPGRCRSRASGSPAGLRPTLRRSTTGSARLARTVDPDEYRRLREFPEPRLRRHLGGESGGDLLDDGRPGRHRGRLPVALRRDRARAGPAVSGRGLARRPLRVDLPRRPSRRLVRASRADQRRVPAGLRRVRAPGVLARDGSGRRGRRAGSLRRRFRRRATSRSL